MRNLQDKEVVETRAPDGEFMRFSSGRQSVSHELANHYNCSEYLSIILVFFHLLTVREYASFGRNENNGYYVIQQKSVYKNLDFKLDVRLCLSV